MDEYDLYEELPTYHIWICHCERSSLITYMPLTLNLMDACLKRISNHVGMHSYPPHKRFRSWMTPCSGLFRICSRSTWWSLSLHPQHCCHESATAHRRSLWRCEPIPSLHLRLQAVQPQAHQLHHFCDLAVRTIIPCFKHLVASNLCFTSFTLQSFIPFLCSLRHFIKLFERRKTCTEAFKQRNRPNCLFFLAKRTQWQAFDLRT